MSRRIITANIFAPYLLGAFKHLPAAPFIEAIELRGSFGELAKRETGPATAERSNDCHGGFPTKPESGIAFLTPQARYRLPEPRMRQVMDRLFAIAFGPRRTIQSAQINDVGNVGADIVGITVASLGPNAVRIFGHHRDRRI